MKVKVDKRGANLHVELTPNAAKKPIVIDLTPAQLQMALAALTTASKVDEFSFQLEV